MPPAPAINPALLPGHRERQAAAARRRRAEVAADTPEERRAAAPSTATLVSFGVACGVAGAAVASAVALPLSPARLLAVTAPPAWLARRWLAQRGFDAPRQPATNLERYAATGAHFALAGAAVAATAQLVLRLYPPHAVRGALVGLGAALVPIVLGGSHSPLRHEATARGLEAWGPSAGRVARTLSWPTRLGALAAAVFVPGSALAAGIVSCAGVVAVGAGVVHAIGTPRPSGHSPTQEALEAQPKLAMAALLGMFVGSALT